MYLFYKNIYYTYVKNELKVAEIFVSIFIFLYHHFVKYFFSSYSLWFILSKKFFHKFNILKMYPFIC